jgi:CRISPR-associated protein Csy1
MPDQRLARAEALLRNGHAHEACGLVAAILDTRSASKEDYQMALLLRAEAHEALRDFPKAIADVREAVGRVPHDARLRNRLGILLVDHGEIPGAIEAFAAAVALDASHSRAWNNLGNALRTAGRLTEARAALQHAVRIQPDYAVAWGNLGIVQRDLGSDSEAEASLRRALSFAPDNRPFVVVLAGMLRAQGRIDEAAELFGRAAGLAKPDAAVLVLLAGTLAERDDLDGAGRTYRAARVAAPRSLRAALGDALTLPMIYRDVSDLKRFRSRFDRGLRRLESDIEMLVRGRRFREVIDDLRWTNFLLAYQGEDDRRLQERFAGVLHRAIAAVGPEWIEVPRRSVRGPRTKVGFASAFFNDGTVGRYFRAWIATLDRDRFEVYVYHLRRDVTPFLREIAPHVDHVRTFADALTPSAIAPVVKGDGLDVLVYPELGMDGIAFALAALRLAPEQCAGWGHPVTTGHPTIDVFFSCAEMEPPGAAAHYAERLIMLPGIGTNYACPPDPAHATRRSLGLPEEVPLFLCPQSLFKIHPENDELLARVLVACPRARLVVFEGRHPALTAKFRERIAGSFERAAPGLDDRLILLPQCDHESYLRVNLACDAMLDTLHWSGGNTTLDAIASGLPVVTLPGRFMRGRQSAAMLRLVGVGELVARDDDHYVRIAQRLSEDAAWRDELRVRIRDGLGGVFGDQRPVRVLGDVLSQLATGS